MTAAAADELACADAFSMVSRRAVTILFATIAFAITSIAPAGATTAPHEVAFQGASAGAFTSACVLRTNGTVACWGNNNMGQLGRTGVGFSNTANTVTGVDHPIAIASNYTASCALLSYPANSPRLSDVKCWGGGLGPVQAHSIAGLPTKIRMVAIGVGRGTACALLATDQVLCFPGGQHPAAVLNHVVQIAVGDTFACALLSNATVQCWGNNNNGELGNGTTNNATNPVTVQHLSKVSQISAGNGFACALLNSGSVKCWGDDEGNELGDGGSAPRSTAPVSVRGVTHALAISSGAFVSCALFTGGTAKCWGMNGMGQLGGGSIDGAGPLQVLDANHHSLTHIASIGFGYHGTCARMDNGSAMCWGGNDSGQLGTGDRVPSLVPVVVHGF